MRLTWIRGDENPSAPSEHVAFDPVTCVVRDGELWLSYGITDGAIQPGVFPKLTSISVVHVTAAGTVERYAGLDAAGAMHPLLVADTSALHLLYHATTHDDDPDGTIRSATLHSGDSAFRPSLVVDGPTTFNEQWGEAGFLGDYFGAVASGGEMMAAYGFVERTRARTLGDDSDAHVAFRRWRSE